MAFMNTVMSRQGRVGELIECACILCRRIRKPGTAACFVCSDGGCACSDGGPGSASCPLAVNRGDDSAALLGWLKSNTETVDAVAAARSAASPSPSMRPTKLSAVLFSCIENKNGGMDALKDASQILDVLGETQQSGQLELLLCDFPDLKAGGAKCCVEPVADQVELLKLVMGDDFYKFQKWVAAWRTSTLDAWDAKIRKKAANALSHSKAHRPPNKLTNTFASALHDAATELASDMPWQYESGEGPPSSKRLFKFVYNDGATGVTIDLHLVLMWSPLCINFVKAMLELLRYPLGCKYGCGIKQMMKAFTE